jgi:RimJ/RimL family protein N-acetyltransferase
VKSIITRQDDRVAAFVASRIGMTGKFGSCTSIGLEDDGQIVAGVLYCDYNQSNVVCHIGAIGKHWMNREYLWFIFHYPFEQIGVKRITVVIEETNVASNEFVQHLGFELETTLKDAGRSGDLLIYRMFKKDCRFLRMKR